MKPVRVVSFAAHRKTVTVKRDHPDDVLPSVRRLTFVCPLCRGKLLVSETDYHCAACGRTYNVQAGIPDFRVFPDPYLDFKADRERTEIVLAALEKCDLASLLDHYWTFSDITPEDLHSKFVEDALRGEERSRIAIETLKGNHPELFTGKKILEIGSGTGDFLAAVSNECDTAVGIDIAMRWLHLSRRRFMDKAVETPPLVCCCAEHLPFADGLFDIVAATSTVEFVKDKAKVVSEAARVLRPEGTFYLNSLNRYSLAADPYSHLWGVGFVPRRWQARYVYLRSRAIYKTQLLSFLELERLTRSFFAAREVTLPSISRSVLDQFSWFRRLQIRIYMSLKDLRIFSKALTCLGPGWNILLKKRSP